MGALCRQFSLQNNSWSDGEAPDWASLHDNDTQLHLFLKPLKPSRFYEQWMICFDIKNINNNMQ